MLDVLSLSGSQILGMTKPEQLFGDPTTISELYKQLAKRWHPDVGDTGDVMAHINVLHGEAKHLVDKGNWETDTELRFSAGGKTYVLRYYKAFDFELGRVYLSPTHVTYVVRNEFADFVTCAVDAINGLRTPNDDIKKDAVKTSNFSNIMSTMDRYLPMIGGYYETTSGIVLMLNKPADLIRMRDLLEYSGGKIDPHHVAWMVSRMLHHASYLEWANLTHNDFSLDTLFVCPEHHTVCVLGGWWYAKRAGDVLKGLSQRSFKNGPLLVDKKASLRSDVTLAKLTGLELLGDANALHLLHDKTIPPPMLNWLRTGATGSAMRDYAEWREHVLEGSFGPRRFVKMPVTATDVYSLH